MDGLMEELAREMWAAYSARAGWKTLEGKPLYTWEELGDDHRQCWITAAMAAWDWAWRKRP